MHVSATPRVHSCIITAIAHATKIKVGFKMISAAYIIRRCIYVPQPLFRLSKMTFLQRTGMDLSANRDYTQISGERLAHR